MQLVFVSREEYRRRNNDEYIRQLKQQYPKCMVIPEGGNNALGVRGCSEIVQHIHHHIGSDYDYIALPCGTGATLAGLLCAIPADKTLLGFSVLKAPGLIEAEVLRSLAESSKIASGLWEIQEAYHCGGYARLNQQLVDFVRSFEHKFNINLDYIYTGKCFLGLFDMINKKNFRPGSRVVVIHTGGLQGNRGLYDKVQKFPVQHENLLSC
jgi:1-aminocyclopropane-1-carboxylate deaminase